SVTHHLRDPGSIPQIDEHHHAMVAPTLNPAVQDDGLSDRGLREFPAPMSSDLHATFAFLERAHPARLTGLFGRGACCSVSSAEASFCSASSRNAFASRSVRYLNSPDARSPNDSGPILTRVSFKTGWPTASNIRFTWCWRPSRIVISSQEFCLAFLIFLTTAGTVMPSSSCTPCSNDLMCSSVSTCLILMR